MVTGEAEDCVSGCPPFEVALFDGRLMDAEVIEVDVPEGDDSSVDELGWRGEFDGDGVAEVDSAVEEMDDDADWAPVVENDDDADVAAGTVGEEADPDKALLLRELVLSVREAAVRVSVLLDGLPP